MSFWTSEIGLLWSSGCLKTAGVAGSDRLLKCSQPFGKHLWKYD